MKARQKYYCIIEQLNNWKQKKCVQKSTKYGTQGHGCMHGSSTVVPDEGCITGMLRRRRQESRCSRLCASQHDQVKWQVDQQHMRCGVVINTAVRNSPEGKKFASLVHVLVHK